MKFIQDHPRLSTVGAIVIAAAVFLLLFVASRVDEADLPASTTATNDAGTRPDDGAADGQYDPGPGAGNGDASAPTDLEAISGGATPEATIEFDIDNDGALESLVLIRGEGDERPLDWYLFDDNGAGLLFERKDVPHGQVLFDGPRIVETEAVYGEGDEPCCPSGQKRTYFVWRDGGLVESRVEAVPAGAPVP